MRKCYLFLAFLSFALYLHCMEEGPYNDVVNGIIINKINKITYFSHGDICSLALVNKIFSARIQKTVALRKDYLKKT